MSLKHIGSHFSMVLFLGAGGGVGKWKEKFEALFYEKVFLADYL